MAAKTPTRTAQPSPTAATTAPSQAVSVASSTATKPEADQPAPPRASRRDTFVAFAAELDQHRDKFIALLPQTVTWERFKVVALTAVRQNPDILAAAVNNSLLSALIEAARDGLMPDGREGFINVYNMKVTRRKEGSNATYEDREPHAAWTPMLYGIRKRAKDLGDILIDAQVVCSNDVFDWQQGDEPRIVHKPAPLGHPDGRGALVGSYAIFRAADGTILHREVMYRAEVMATKDQSRAKNSLMWTTFEAEGWKKVVVRRGSKTIPLSEKLDQIVRREDDDFPFNDGNKQQEGETTNAQVSQQQARPALAGPPKAPTTRAAKPASGNGAGGDAVPVGDGARGAAPAVEEAQVVDQAKNGDRPTAQPATADAGTPAAAGSPAPLPPGVNPASKLVDDYAAFAGWAEVEMLAAADDGVEGVFDVWTQIEAYRTAMPPNWFDQLIVLRKLVIAGIGEGDEASQSNRTDSG